MANVFKIQDDNGDDIKMKDVEMTTNKVTSISSNSTNDQYPSAKCVYDLIGNLENLLSEL